MTILPGCAHSPIAPGDVSVQIPRDCEQLARNVSVPDPARDRANGKLALARTTAALVEANGNIDATRECQANQRERFANK